MRNSLVYLRRVSLIPGEKEEDMSRSASAAVLSLLLVSPAAFAQTTGSINGTITDNTGAVLPGVTVTATSPALMGTQVAVSNEQGVYRFPALPTGTYALKYELSGFAHGQSRRHHRHPRVHGDGADAAQAGGRLGNRHRHGRIAGR